MYCNERSVRCAYFILRSTAHTQQDSFAPPRPIGSIHVTDIPRQEKENRGALLKPQASRYFIETPKISLNKKKTMLKRLRPILEEKNHTGSSFWISTAKLHHRARTQNYRDHKRNFRKQKEFVLRRCLMSHKRLKKYGTKGCCSELEKPFPMHATTSESCWKEGLFKWN
jgi:hypothetical protein